MGKRIARAGLAGFLLGILVLGVGGRLAMRFVAVIIHQTPHFGIGASLGIVLIGGILGLLSGVVYGMLLERSWPTHSSWKGFGYGTLVFAVLVLFQPSAIRAEVSAARAYWWAIVPLFWTLCVCYAVALTTTLHSRIQQPAEAA